MAKQVPWTKFIYDTFCEEAMLNETERFIMITRIDGWTVTKQAMHLHMSEANVHRLIKILKCKYDAVAAITALLRTSSTTLMLNPLRLRSTSPNKESASYEALFSYLNFRSPFRSKYLRC